MVTQNDTIVTETLYQGMTRPALLGGLPYRYTIILFMITALIMINVNVLYGIGAAALGWVYGYWVFKDDYHQLNIILLKYFHSPYIRNRKYWQSNTYDPT